ncbi:hypothetical protein ROHU_023115 [Labeo rohita]|uniref:Uncharacterized protein n=1 Tax=Labeo rohita TaxID=84645 RepID=A0A498MNG0_LABRO|nr:hypothetical protein ROHU_023115 [Labeo rohita]
MEVRADGKARALMKREKVYQTETERVEQDVQTGSGSIKRASGSHKDRGSLSLCGRARIYGSRGLSPPAASYGPPNALRKLLSSQEEKVQQENGHLGYSLKQSERD